MSTEKSDRVIAVFDFDGTLAARDSLLPFLAHVVGLPRFFLIFLGALGPYLIPPPGQDRRSAMKSFLLQKTLAGRTLDSLAPAIAFMKTWPRWKTTLTKLKAHHAEGHHILVATGSLDLYIKAMLMTVPHDGVLCTHTEIKGGVLTGQMQGGNCVRQRKAELVAAYMREHGPFTESWGYGNAPHDLPMMALMTHKVIV